MQYLLFMVFFLTTSLFADDDLNNIRNLCDTLRLSSESVMKVRIDTIYDMKFINDTMKSVNYYRSLDSINPIRGSSNLINTSIPTAFDVECLKAIHNCKIGFYDASQKKWVAKDTSCYSQIFDIYESPIEDYDSSNTYNWIYYNLEDWSSDESFFVDKMLLSVTPELRASGWLSIGYIADTTESKISYTVSASGGVDSASVVEEVKSSFSSLSNKVLYSQMLKFVLAEEKLIQEDIEEPPLSLEKMNQNSRPKYSIQKTYGGFLIRGPKGEIPNMRYLNGSFISGEMPVSSGVYFISIQKGSWHRILVQD